MKSLQNSIGYGISNGYYSNTTEKTETDRAKTIKDALNTIDGVESAAVVITGKTALIGLSLNTNDLDEIARLKNEAAKLAYETDTTIKNTSVTANSTIKEMIQNMEEGKLNFTLLPT
ncbi:MAG: YhcN/YlaJ family sporulation lipoprotein [Lachnospiraceae bacterium]|nr:YhcN/YlaJ family sporulation lipoprotein [Lachnospiraceae bacterium]